MSDETRWERHVELKAKLAGELDVPVTSDDDETWYPLPNTAKPLYRLVPEPEVVAREASAERRGREQMIEALRDKGRYDKWADTEGMDSPWTGRIRYADYLESVAASLTESEEK